MSKRLIDQTGRRGGPLRGNAASSPDWAGPSPPMEEHSNSWSNDSPREREAERAEREIAVTAGH